MRAASVTSADRPNHAGHRASHAQWAAVDWCARLRPAIWLHAARLTADAVQLRRHEPIDDAAALDVVWPDVSRSAAAALTARQACWGDLATAAHQHDDPGALEVLALMASIAWPSAVAAAGHLAIPAARAAGFPDPGRAMFRTFVVPDGPALGWDQAWDTARDAACLVTCRAVHELRSRTPSIWTAPSDQARTAVHEAIRRALAPVRIELTSAAVSWMESGR